MQDSESQIYCNRLMHQMVIEEAARLVKSHANSEHPMILVPLQISVDYLLGFKIAFRFSLSSFMIDQLESPSSSDEQNSRYQHTQFSWLAVDPLSCIL